jgi:outer membrane protein assembly factor BamB
VELGNLVCFGDQLISQSPLAVASFVLLSDQLQQKLEQRLAANPRDVDALALQAQILLQVGKADESLALLRRAAELAPDRTTVRDLLVKVMLSLVRQDFAKHAALSDELDKLVSDAVLRREVLRWRVQGLAQRDRIWEAFGALLELADQELAAAATGAPAGPLQTIDRERNVRMDRWLQAQLKLLVERADSDTKDRMAAELKSRLDRALSIGSAGQLRMFLNLFGFHQVSQAARLALIDRLVAAEAFLEAEVVAGELLTDPSPALVATGLVSLATIYEKAKRPELAARMYQDLARRFDKAPVLGGATGEDVAAKAAQNAALKPYFAPWPAGEIDVRDDAGGAAMQRSLSPLQITHYFGAAPRGLRASFDSGRSEVALRSDLGQVVAAASIRNDNSTRRSPYFSSGNGLFSAQANGHLLVANLGTDVLAMNGLRTDRASDALLWRQETTEDLGSSNNAMQVSRSAPRNPLLGARSDGFNAPRRLSYGTGPVTSSGVCLQRGRQLVCVDPVSGQTLWERSSSPQAEIPQQADIFGDEELLFIAESRFDARPEDVLVLSALDGSVVGRRKVESAERRFATHGRRVLVWEEKNNLVTLRLLDAWDNQRELWSRQVANSSRAFLIESDELAILEAGGQFSVVSLATGRMLFSAPLAPEPDLAWINVFRSEDQYLLLASHEKEPPSRSGLTPLPASISMQQRGMHGRSYAFNRATGKLEWQSPAFVSHHYLPPDQPAQSPLLLFVASRQANNKMTTAVLAIDRRTGRSVYEQDLNGHASTAEVTVDPVKQSVTLALIGQTNRSLNFLFTDRPLPPQPPAQTGEMASSSAGQPRGNVVKSLGAAIDLFKRGSEGLFGPPEAPPAQLPLPASRP